MSLNCLSCGTIAHIHFAQTINCVIYAQSNCGFNCPNTGWHWRFRLLCSTVSSI